MQTEEEQGPQEVSPQLGGKQDNSGLHGFVFPSLHNDKVQGYPHQDVENRPDRTEHVIRWCEPGFVERCIPVTPDIVRMPITAPETKGMRIHTNANATDRRVILSMQFTDTREEMRVSL
jgi:hypothetical protein